VGSRPRLICIPSSDVAFANYANEIYEVMSADEPGPLGSDDFAHRLQETYPTALVRERHRLADLWPGDGPVWYVIRRAFGSRIAATVEVPVDRATVFQIYVDRMPEWQVVVDLRPLNRRAGVVGTEFAAAYEFLGKRLNGRMRIVGASPPRAVRVEAEGMGVDVWYVTTFHPTPSGTRVDVVGDYVMPTRFIPKRVGRLVVERRIARDIEKAHDALRALCLRERDAAGELLLQPVELARAASA
jgi:hypothetical protein